MRTSIRHFVLSTLLLFGTQLCAQEKQPITLENMNDPALTEAFSVPRTWWLKDNTALILDTLKPAGKRHLEHLNPATGKRTPLYDYQKAKEGLLRFLPADSLKKFDPAPKSITEDGKYGHYVIAGDIFLVELATAAITRVTNTKEKEKSANFSPDGAKLAFIRENDIHLYDIKSKTESRLTMDGGETTLNGTLSWVYWEEIFGRQDIGYWWSHDSKSIAFLQTDESVVSVQHYVDITPWTPTVTTQRYPKVGEVNPTVKVGIIDIATGNIIWTGLDQGAYEYVIRVDWLPDSRQFCLRTLNRLQTELDFYFVNRSTGAAKFILKDTNEGWINMSDDLHFMKDGKHFIISSERDDYAHLYRFTIDGKLVNQITKGPWPLSSSTTIFWVRKAIAGVDEKNGWIYFTALEKSSVEKHLYRINIDGTGMKRLTKETGSHLISMSPNTRFYFDRFSNTTTLPSLTLYDAGGTKKMDISAPNTSALKKYDLRFAELLEVPARDGYPLPSSLLKPRNLEPGKRYPVIFMVYGGPSAPTVSNAIAPTIIWENVLVSNGYLLMKVDHRAATARSKKLENMLLFRTPHRTELDDLLDAVRWMKQQPYVDPDRFGIYGWSGGGTNTMLAMTRSKEFKAGIAGAGVTDFRFYDTKWAEAMMRTEKENLKGYEESSLLKYAKDLHGKLMLIHGTHDDNVHPQNTWAFMKELIKENILFELMVYPMRGHSINDKPERPHMNKVMLDFWKRNL